MRLLALNPNTSAEVTEAFVAELRRIAPAGVEIEGVTGAFGAPIVTTEAENLVAAHAALELAATHATGFDGVILAISFDTARRALAELLPVPVVGITEAALGTLAAQGQPPIGAVIFGASSQPLYQRLLAEYGCDPVGWEVIEFASQADYLNANARDAAVLDAVMRLADAGAGAVVLLGAAIVGMAARLSPRAPVPLQDGAAALDLCRARIASGARLPPKPDVISESLGLSPALSALISRQERS